MCVNHASLGCDRFSFVNVSLTKRGTEQALAVERAKAHFVIRDKILLTISKTYVLLLVDGEIKALISVSTVRKQKSVPRPLASPPFASSVLG